jgi:uncharacterized protein (DUF1778 family)
MIAPNTPITPNERCLSRILPITCKVSSKDLSAIQAKASVAGKTLSRFMRDSALNSEVTPTQNIPAINEEQWQQLSRVASNLNQLTFLCHTQEKTPLSKEVISDIAATRNLLHEVREALLGNHNKEEESNGGQD